MKILSLCALVMLIACSNSKKNHQKTGLVTNEIDYSTETTNLKGYTAYKKGKKNLPGIIIIHEWWGHNQYVRERAEQLAELGYYAFAIDMYGEGKNVDHPKEANAFMTQTMKNMPEAKARIMAAINTIKEQPQVDSSKLAAIGYCFGGGVVLQAVQMGVDLKAAVTFHGGLSGIKAFPKNSETKLLVLNGADDPMVTGEQISKLKTEAKKSKLDLTFINYPDAKHAFTNPGATEKGEKFGLPLAYNKQADEESWEEMKKLFRESL